ncbi:MAG: Zn-ribbon domain-containing OB-fold protein [Candidatus Micrarchaeia archaeon]
MGVSPSLSWRNIAERYVLMGSKCDRCGSYYFPVRELCPKCRRKGVMKKHVYKGKGEVYSYTQITSPPPGFELETPYILAIVKLSEGVKITTQIVDCEVDEIYIGMPVEVVFRKIQEEGDEGPIHYGFKFIPEGKAKNR